MRARAWLSGCLGLAAAASCAVSPKPGLTPQMLADYVQVQMPKVRACYAWSLETNPRLAGKIVFSYTLDAAGAPHDGGILSNTMPPSFVPSCLELLISDWRFPKPAAGEMVVVSFPFVFQAGTGTLGSQASDPSVISASNRVIIDRESARAWNFLDADDFWVPAMADVQALEEQLPRYLREEMSRKTARMVAAGIPADTAHVPLAERALLYHRQYVGIVTSHRYVIFANFFSDDPPIDWRRQGVFSYGGGDTAFTFKYDVDERRFFDLFINAPA